MADDAPGRGPTPTPATLRTVAASAAGRLLLGAVAAVALVTVVGLALLWPTGDGVSIPGAGRATVGAEVREVHVASCGGPTEQRCRTVVAEVSEGRDEGLRVSVSLGPSEVSPDLHVGQHVRLIDQSSPAPQAGGDGTAADDPSAGATGDDGPVYAFSGVDRRLPLGILAVAFALLGALVARGRGLLALLGTALSLSLVALWLVPAILDGRPPVLTALVGALAVMFVTTILTYGVTVQSLAAVTGIGGTLLVAALLSALWVDLAGLDGKEGDLSSFALQSGGELPLQGILLAGMVIGALGVITDTVVSQVSTVAALHRTDPSLPPRRLYAEAFVVGRDHLAATIHTLVLAYAGATLPLLLVASANGVGFGDAVNDASLAEPIVSTLVGSAALILSVPLSTALAAVLVGRLPARALAGAEHHHHHH